MNLKLNTESMAGQWLGMAANQAAGGKAGGEDFEQMLLKMSTAQDELAASPEKPTQSLQKSGSQGAQGPAESKGAAKDAAKDANDKPVSGKADKAVNAQSGETTAAAGEEPVEVQELAAMLGMQQIVLSFAEAPVGEQAQAVVAENMASTQAVYQEAAQEVHQDSTELAAPGEQAVESGQPEALGQFAAVAEAAQTEQADVKQFGEQTAEQTVAQAQTEDEPEAEVLQMSGRVFEELHTPVKVAEAEHLTQTVQPEAADGAEQIAQHIQQALLKGEQVVRINLNPANLGSLTVEIARMSDGTLSVILSAVTEKAAGLLEKHSAGLQTLLMNNGQGQVRVEVENRMSDQPTQQFLNPEGNDGKEQRQQQQQQREQHEAAPQDFLQQLRLGLISLEQAV